MKNLLAIVLLLISTAIFGQTDNSELLNFIKSHDLQLIRTKHFNIKKKKNKDSLFTFYSDSVRFEFQLSNLKNVNHKKGKFYYRYMLAVEKLKEEYSNGINSMLITEMESKIEGLILAGALSQGFLNNLVFKGKNYDKYNCRIYGIGKSEDLYVYSIGNDEIIFTYSPVVCWGGPKFREP